MRRSLINIRKNPSIAKELPTKQFVNDDGAISKKQILYVCGFAGNGSLGMARYYKPKNYDDPSKLENKDLELNRFKRLNVYAGSEKVKDIACGNGFTVMAAKLDNSTHTAFGFGLNQQSQLGYQAQRPGFPLEMVATPLPMFIPTESPIEKVSCGRAHTILLNKSGQVFSLGLNSFGQCGRPIDEKEEYFGSRIVHCLSESLPPNISEIECGYDHTMFLSDTGKVYSCGWGADGQTGLGHYNNQSEPRRIKGDLKDVKIIKVSSCCDTVLALDNEGNLFGWGNSEYSQFRTLGLSNQEQFNIPRLLRTQGIPGKIIDIAAGGTVCAILNNRGQVFVWGFGILGKGPNVEHSSEPTLIPESLFGMNVYNSHVKVVKIYAGMCHFAAITNQGDLYAWGKNRSKALGFRHGRDQYFPARVDINMSHARKVALGVDHTCVLADKII